MQPGAYIVALTTTPPKIADEDAMMTQRVTLQEGLGTGARSSRATPRCALGCSG